MGRSATLAAALAAASSCAAFTGGPTLALRRADAGVHSGASSRPVAARPGAARLAQAGASRLAMVVDPAQATDAFIALGAAAATTKAAAGATAGAAAATAASAGAQAAPVDEVLRQLQAVQAQVLALPAVVLKDPAVKVALSSVQSFAGSVQGAEAKVLQSIEGIPAVKQLQAELTVLAKALEPYKQAASAKLNIESMIKQLPPPLQAVEKEIEKAAKMIAEIITVISRDGDKDLFNGYPFNPQALMVSGSACHCCGGAVSTACVRLI